MDVDDDLSVSAGIERTITEYGGIDAIVTCAGWGLAGAIEQTSINEAKAQMETILEQFEPWWLPSLRSESARATSSS